MGRKAHLCFIFQLFVLFERTVGNAVLSVPKGFRGFDAL